MAFNEIQKLIKKENEKYKEEIILYEEVAIDLDKNPITEKDVLNDKMGIMDIRVEINNKIATLKVKIKKVFPNHLYGKYFWGSCAEDMAATDIMKKNHSHKIPLGNAFGEARRVRTGQSIPMCETCKNIFK